MKRRVAVMLGVALAAVGLSMGPARAATVLVVDNGTVPGCALGAVDHATIQAAVAAAHAGDTIRVCPGDYAGPVTVDKDDLTFEGAKVGIDARSRTQNGESVITSNSAGGVVRLLADGIVWDGFLIADNLEGPGMYTGREASGYVIRNTVFNDNGLGLYLNSSGDVLTRVRHNRFTANNEFEGTGAGTGIYSDKGASCILIADNLFERHNGAGILFADSGEPQHCVDVERNTSVEDRTFAAFFASSHVKLFANIVQGRPDDPTPGSAIFIGARNDGVVVHRNHITSTAGNGIDVRDTGGDRRRGTPPRNVDVRRNTVRNAGQNGIDVAASGAEEYVVRVNLVVDSVEAGIHAGQESDGAVFAYNTALDNHPDCKDESTGSRTADTKNTWRFNTGRTSSPDGLCGPDQPAPEPSRPRPPRPRKQCYPWRN
jgi:nitrous oxidase accessory protein NosD